MNRPFTTVSFCALALVLAGCGGKTGEKAGDGSEALAKTGAALEAKVGAPGEKAEMPGADDADVKAFDAEAEKGLAALGTAAMPVDGLNSYDRLCGPAAKIAAAYVSAGVGATGGGLPTDDKAKVAQMTKNAERYMPQMFTPLLYSAHCTAVHLPSIEKALAGQDLKGKEGAVAQIRDGAFGQANGLLQMAADPSLDAARKKRILDLLARDAGNFATVLNPERRQALGQGADAVAQAWPEGKPQAERIKAGLTGAPCGKLCSL